MKTMTNFAATLIVTATFGLSAQVAQAGCGTSEAACEIEGGEYHLKMPEGEVKGTILYLHGAGGSGAGSLNNKVWVPAALERGYAVAAPDGSMREGRRGRGWFFHPSRPKTRDDVAFVKRVRDDLAENHGLEADKIALGGFSIGGSMASYVACEDPSAFSAYVPVAGGIWRPHPTECAGPVKLLHTHGWTDTTVPLEGRVVNRVPNTDPTAFMQGDVFHTMGLWRVANGCVHVRADKFVTKGPFLQRGWKRCDPDTALEFALFPGGHTVPEGWAEMAIDWIEGL